MAASDRARAPDPAALGPERIDRILEGATLVYFDGRLTEVALKLAAAAEARGFCC